MTRRPCSGFLLKFVILCACFWPDGLSSTEDCTSVAGEPKCSSSKIMRTWLIIQKLYRDPGANPNSIGSIEFDKRGKSVLISQGGNLFLVTKDKDFKLIFTQSNIITTATLSNSGKLSAIGDRYGAVIVDNASGQILTKMANQKKHDDYSNYPCALRFTDNDSDLMVFRSAGLNVFFNSSGNNIISDPSVDCPAGISNNNHYIASYHRPGKDDSIFLQNFNESALSAEDEAIIDPEKGDIKSIVVTDDGRNIALSQEGSGIYIYTREKTGPQFY